MVEHHPLLQLSSPLYLPLLLLLPVRRCSGCRSRTKRPGRGGGEAEPRREPEEEALMVEQEDGGGVLRRLWDWASGRKESTHVAAARELRPGPRHSRTFNGLTQPLQKLLTGGTISHLGPFVIVRKGSGGCTCGDPSFQSTADEPGDAGRTTHKERFTQASLTQPIDRPSEPTNHGAEKITAW